MSNFAPPMELAPHLFCSYDAWIEQAENLVKNLLPPPGYISGINNNPDIPWPDIYVTPLSDRVLPVKRYTTIPRRPRPFADLPTVPSTNIPDIAAASADAAEAATTTLEDDRTTRRLAIIDEVLAAENARLNRRERIGRIITTCLAMGSTAIGSVTIAAGWWMAARGR